MKKIVRILGVTLSLIVLASCSKDDDNNPDTGLSEGNLKGTYSYTAVSVQEAVDLNGDGVKNNDLKKEGYKACTLDNLIEITEKNYSFINQGTQCSSSETNLVFTYTLDKTAKKITLFLNGENSGELTNIEFFDFNGSKTYQYQVYDADLKQNVVYGMTAVK
jgi:hypothetical protein